MKAAIIGIVIVALLLFGVALPRYLAPDDLADCTTPTSTGQCQKADAIIAISGGDTLARSGEAVKLYKSGWAPALIFSGAASDPGSPSNAAVMKKEAVASGVPASSITIEELSKTTGENAIKTAQITSARGYKRVILVTSGYHERRATLQFRSAMPGEQVVSHPVKSDNQWSNWWWATPIGWWLSIGELIKIGGFYAGFGR